MAGAAALGALLLLFDFEDPGLSRDWAMSRGGSAARVEDGGSWCLHVRPAPGSVVRSGRVPHDWRGVGAVRFRARAAAPTTIELRVPSGRAPAASWRRVELEAGAWQQVEVELPWMRRADGPPPSWQDVQGLVFGFRDGTEVWIDDVQLVPGSPALAPQDLAAHVGGSLHLGRFAAVISTQPGLEGQLLAQRLDRVAEAVLQDLPFLSAPPGPVPLVVFSDREAYQEGVIQLAAAFGATLKPPGHDGFTLEGIASSSWDPGQGIGRPVYTHEFVHAFLSASAGLPNSGEWLQEGLATWTQQRFHRQANLEQVIRTRLQRALPLSRLGDGQPIPTVAYGEAWTVVGTLLQVPAWQGTLPRLFEQAAALGTSSLVTLGVDLEALDRDRRLWVDGAFDG